MADARHLTREMLWELFHHRRFLMDFGDRLRPEYFGSNESRYLSSLALDHWQEKKSLLPETAVFDRIDTDEDDDLLERSAVTASTLYALWDSMQETADASYLFTAVTDFCRRSALALALVEAGTVLSDEGPDAALKVIDEARILIEPKPTRTVKVFAGIDEVLSRIRVKLEDANYASTGLPSLDKFLGGGVLPGELAALIAPTGRGKTMWLCYVAAMATMFGMEALYYTLEVDRDEIALRTLSSVSGVNINAMKFWAMYGQDPEYNQEATEDDKDDDGNVVKYVKPQDALAVAFKKRARVGAKRREIDVIDLSHATVSTIQADIERRKRDGDNPKLVIIDYADRLEPRGRHEKKDHAELEIFRDLAGLAKEQQVVVWTAIQGNRQSLGKENLDLRQISGAYAKAWEADFVIAAGQNDEMMKRNQFTFGLAKARRVSGSGQTGKQLSVYYDFSKSQFRDWLKASDQDEFDERALTHVGKYSDEEEGTYKE